MGLGGPGRVARGLGDPGPAYHARPDGDGGASTAPGRPRSAGVGPLIGWGLVLLAVIAPWGIARPTGPTASRSTPTPSISRTPSPWTVHHYARGIPRPADFYTRANAPGDRPGEGQVPGDHRDVLDHDPRPADGPGVPPEGLRRRGTEGPATPTAWRPWLSRLGVRRGDPRQRRRRDAGGAARPLLFAPVRPDGADGRGRPGGLVAVGRGFRRRRGDLAGPGVPRPARSPTRRWAYDSTLGWSSPTSSTGPPCARRATGRRPTPTSSRPAPG